MKYPYIYVYTCWALAFVLIFADMNWEVFSAAGFVISAMIDIERNRR